MGQCNSEEKLSILRFYKIRKFVGHIVQKSNSHQYKQFSVNKLIPDVVWIKNADRNEQSKPVEMMQQSLRVGYMLMNY